MAKVKTNFENMNEISSQLDKASQNIQECILSLWGEKFDDIYFNYIESGYLDSLYDDATDDLSSKIFSGGSSLLCGAGAGVSCAFATGALTASGICACIPIAGWIAAAIILAACAVIGIVSLCMDFSTDKIKREAKGIFEDLITQCVTGEQMNYKSLVNCDTKASSMQLTISKILLLINEFNEKYAKFTSEEVSDAGLKNGVVEGEDGVTLTAINTNINIDDKEYTLSTSEAMNAFYTYESTVMSAEFEATLLEEKGIKVDYNSIVKNANSFMTTTVESKLYTKEFVESVLPKYSSQYSFDSSISTVASTNGLTTDTFSSVLSQVPGALGASTGLLGAAFLGTLVDNNRNTGSSSTSNVNSTNPSNGSSNRNNSSNSDNNSNGNSEVIGVITPVDDNKPDEVQINPVNDVEVPEIVEIELPETVEVIDEIVNYDDLARTEYESKGSDSIDKYREEIIDAINEKFDSGDLDPIKNKLKEYGYSDSDIENIVKDRQSTITAILAGDEKQELVKIAKNLAKNDGVNDYNSIYEENNSYNDTIDGTLNTTLVNMNENEELVSAREDVTKAYDDYKEKVNIANESIAATSLASSAVTKAMDEYSNKYNTQDTSQWDRVAAEDYANLVNKYNDSVKASESAIKDVENAKSSYEEAGSKYSQIKEEFLNNVKKENDRTNSFKDSNNADKSIYDDSDDDKSDNNSNGNVSSNDSSVPSDNVSSGTTINISDDDLLNLINPSEDNSSINF